MATRKPNPTKPKDTLIRVSVAFASAVKKASSLEDLSIAQFADAHLLAAVEARYRNALLNEAKRMEGKR